MSVPEAPMHKYGRPETPQHDVGFAGNILHVKPISEASGEQFPGTPVFPFLSPWATDSSQLRLHNVQAFGLMPFPLGDEDRKRMHADDERIPLASFAEGVQYLYRVVSEFAVAK